MKSKLKRQIQETVNFTALQREKVILISQTDQNDLFDIRLMLYGQPSKDPFVPSPVLKAIDNLQFYINGVNYTKQLQEELKQLLQAKNQTKVKDSYRKGVNRWLAFATEMNFDSVNIEKEKQDFEVILTQPLHSQLDKLGNATIGFRGNLHIFNFLYNFIELDAVSLNAIVARKNPKTKSIKNMVPLTIVFSHGPAPSYEKFSAKEIPMGQLNYNLDIIYENPLYDLMVLLNEQAKDIQMKLESQRINYYDNIINQLQTIEHDSNLKLSELAKSVKDLQDTFSQLKTT